MQIIGGRRKFLRETRCQLGSKTKTQAFHEAASRFETDRLSRARIERRFRFTDDADRVTARPVDASGGEKFEASGRA